MDQFEQIREKKILVFLENETTCCLCGTLLKFEYKVTQDKVNEEGYCPSCEIRAKKRDHKIH